MEVERQHIFAASQFKCQSYRLETFTNAIEEFADRQSYTPALRFVLAGFIFVKGLRGTDSYIKCPWCNLALRRIHTSHSPLLWHKILTKNQCPFILRNQINDKHDIVTLTILPGHSTAAATERTPQDEANLTIHGTDRLVTGAGAQGGSEELASLTLSAGTTTAELKEIYKRFSGTLLYVD